MLNHLRARTISPQTYLMVESLLLPKLTFNGKFCGSLIVASDPSAKNRAPVPSRKHITGTTREKQVIILSEAKPGKIHDIRQLREAVLRAKSASGERYVKLTPRFVRPKTSPSFRFKRPSILVQKVIDRLSDPSLREQI
jgi:hypothetical protein